MGRFIKPAVYNPAAAERRIRELEKEVERLKKERTNLEIRCRILEEDRDKTVAYICDGFACEEGCSHGDCKHTRNISHAANFDRGDGNTWWER